MTTELITCMMCGHRFDPTAQMACIDCPLQKNCQLVCCPVCGYETVDPGKSYLARIAKHWISPDPGDHQDKNVSEPGGRLEG